MANQDRQNVFVIVYGGLLLSLQGAVLVRALFRRQHLSYWRQIRTAFASLAAKLICARSTGADDKISHYVRQRMDSQSLKSIRSLSGKVGIVYSLALAIVFLRTLRGVDIVLAPVDLVLLFISTNFFVAFQLMPSMIQVGRMGFWYSLLMAKACFDMWLFRDPQMILPHSGALFILRIFYSLAYQKMPAVLCWNLLYFVAALDSSRRILAPASESKSHTGGVQGQNFDTMVIFEFFSLFIVVFTALSAAQASRSQLREEFRATTLRAESTALTTMLELVCDVVIELDKDLRIKGDSRKFAGLLAVDGSRVQGQQIQQFMPLAEDQQRLKDVLLTVPVQSGEASSGGLALGCQTGVVHVKLRDSWNNSFSVELFHVQFECLGQRSFFVGLREHADQSIPELQSLDPATRGRGPLSDEAAASSGASERRARRVCGRGTPPTMLGRSLVADEHRSERDSSSESGPRPASPTGSHAEEAAANATPPTQGTETLLCTGQKGFDLTLVDAMLRWHVRRTEESCCCPFHAAVGELKCSAQRLAGYGCMPVFSFDFGRYGQCQKCRLIFDQSDPTVNGNRLCRFCGTVHRKEPPRNIASL